MNSEFVENIAWLIEETIPLKPEEFNESQVKLRKLLSRFESEIRQDQKHKDARQIRFSPYRFYPEYVKNKVGEKDSVIHILDAHDQILGLKEED